MQIRQIFTTQLKQLPINRADEWRSKAIPWMVLLIFLILSLSACTNSSTKEVKFADPNLETAVRQIIGKPYGVIFQGDLQGVTELSLTHRRVSSQKGIEYLIDLELLELREVGIGDISPLSKLTKLEKLYLDYNQIDNINALAELNLRSLSLYGNPIDFSQGSQARRVLGRLPNGCQVMRD